MLFAHPQGRRDAQGGDEIPSRTETGHSIKDRLWRILPLQRSTGVFSGPVFRAIPAFRRSEAFVEGIELAVLDPRARSQEKSGPFGPLAFRKSAPIRPPSPS
jgi:hypothetical protein